jgi:23S rRNA (guanosine2251-2'-O)-methyltransferase
MLMDNQIEIYGIRSIIEAIESSKEISRVYLLKSDSPQSSLFRSLVILLERKNIKSSFVPKEKFKKYSEKKPSRCSSYFISSYTVIYGRFNFINI